MSVAIQSPDQVVIAVDPHKASWTAAAVDASLQPLATYPGPGQPRRLPGVAPFRPSLARRRLGDRRRIRSRVHR